MPVSAHGICTHWLHAAACVGLSGASEAPKSTSPFVISVIPVPDPTDAYVTELPVALCQPVAHSDSSGWISVEPAPDSDAAEADAVAPVATLATTAMTLRQTNLLQCKM